MKITLVAVTTKYLIHVPFTNYCRSWIRLVLLLFLISNSLISYSSAWIYLSSPRIASSKTSFITSYYKCSQQQFPNFITRNKYHRYQRSQQQLPFTVLFKSQREQSTTDNNNTSRSSSLPLDSTAVKIRAMASFVSMSLLESMLEAGIPIEKLIPTMSSSTTTNDSDNTSPIDHDTISDEEISTPMHIKEGDRIINMLDTFVADNDNNNNTTSSDRTTTNNNDSTLYYNHHHYCDHLLIPPIPNAISTAFGRPLPIIREHVLPLQPVQSTDKDSYNENRKTMINNKITATNIEATTMIQSTTTTASSSSSRTIKAVTDEDPYGE
jgi:hypothetical protein